MTPPKVPDEVQLQKDFTIAGSVSLLYYIMFTCLATTTFGLRHLDVNLHFRNSIDARAYYLVFVKLFSICSYYFSIGDFEELENKGLQRASPIIVVVTNLETFYVQII